MCWKLVTRLLILISFLTLSKSSEARTLKNHIHPSAVVVGTVYCDTCFQDDLSHATHFISGATVSVECQNAAFKFKKEVETDENGEFKVQLPLAISKHEKEIKGCRVRLVKSSEPYCAVASAASSSSIRLKAREPRKHFFSAGFFSFKPLSRPDLCNRLQSVTPAKPDPEKSSKESIAKPQFFLPPIFGFPPPGLGLPTIPGLPGLPTPSLPVPPVIPGLPGLSPPSLPVPPVIPGLPGLSPPSLPVPPVIPGLPGLSPPSLPIPPGLPGLAPPSLPVPVPPVLPVPPVVPGLPGLTPSAPPSLPVPVPPVLPLPPVIPGVPPAKKTSP